MHANRVLTNNALLFVAFQLQARDVADIDPDRFTLRQVDALREDYAQVMEELEFLRELLARLPTRKEQAFTQLRIMFGTAVVSSALTILWFESFWRHCL
jgi:hypothetical protein